MYVWFTEFIYFSIFHPSRKKKKNMKKNRSQEIVCTYAKIFFSRIFTIFFLVLFHIVSLLEVFFDIRMVLYIIIISITIKFIVLCCVWENKIDFPSSFFLCMWKKKEENMWKCIYLMAIYMFGRWKYKSIDGVI